MDGQPADLVPKGVGGHRFGQEGGVCTSLLCRQNSPSFDLAMQTTNEIQSSADSSYSSKIESLMWPM